MKNRRSLFLWMMVFVVGLCLVGGFLWRPGQDGRRVQLNPATVLPAGQKAPNRTPAAFGALAALMADPVLTAEEKAQLQASGEVGKYAKYAEARDEMNGKSINFYGKIVDQFGEPISGVKIKGSVLLAVSPISSANKEVIAESDAGGRFEFVGLKGANFGVLLEKQGYESNGRASRKKDETPSRDNPVVYTMWKLQGAEPMVHTRLNSRLPYESQTAVFVASFDLTAGRRSDSGELRIALTQVPQVVRRGVDRYDWSVKIEVLNGGLMETADIYKNLAPEGGYQTSFLFSQIKADPKWMDQFTTWFYVRTSKGQYGRVLIDLTPGSNDPDAGFGVGLSIETWLNPSGSRNLEYDAAKVIKR